MRLQRPPARPRSPRSAILADTRRFLSLLGRKSLRDGITRQASALAFETLLAMVPLLAAFTFVGKRFFTRYQERIVDALTHVLPYAESTVRARIHEFLEQAETLPQFGLIGFMVVTLFAFNMVEEILNQIWGVTAQRPFRIRLLSFSLLVFWGPLLIGAVFSVLLLLGQRPDFQVLLQEAWLLQLAPFFAVLVGLTMLYWLVPYADVQFRAAFAGGLAAAVLFEILRWGFRLYLRAFGGTADIIYGGFALAIFFMVSIQLAWTIALLGSEISYLTQHFRRWRDPAVMHEAPRETWTGVVALATLVERFLRGEPVTSLHQLANTLLLSPGTVRRVLEPLVDARLLAHPGATEDTYVLAHDPHRVTLADVFALYDEERAVALEPLPPTLSAGLAALRERIQESRRRGLRELTIADVVEGQAPGTRRPSDTGPIAAQAGPPASRAGERPPLR